MIEAREFVLWEMQEGVFSAFELEVTDIGHLHVYVQERILKTTNSAPSLEELDYLGKKPIVVSSNPSNYWLLVYEKGQVASFNELEPI